MEILDLWSPLMPTRVTRIYSLTKSTKR